MMICGNPTTKHTLLQLLILNTTTITKKYLLILIAYIIHTSKYIHAHKYMGMCVFVVRLCLLINVYV